MNGIDKPSIIIQPRDRILLSKLSALRVIDRDQAMSLAGFQSITRANVRLLQLVNAGHLKRLFIGTDKGGKKSLYILTRKGADLAGVPFTGLDRKQNEVIVGSDFIHHQLALNWIYISVHSRSPPNSSLRCSGWSTFRTPISESAPIIPDAYMVLTSSHIVRPCFLEVDLGSEPQKVWTQKTEMYFRLAVSGEFSRKFEQKKFSVLVVVLTEK